MQNLLRPIYETADTYQRDIFNSRREIECEYISVSVKSSGYFILHQIMKTETF